MLSARIHELNIEMTSFMQGIEFVRRIEPG